MKSFTYEEYKRLFVLVLWMKTHFKTTDHPFHSLIHIPTVAQKTVHLYDVLGTLEEPKKTDKNLIFLAFAVISQSEDLDEFLEEFAEIAKYTVELLNPHWIDFCSRGMGKAFLIEYEKLPDLADAKDLDAPFENAWLLLSLADEEILDEM